MTSCASFPFFVLFEFSSIGFKFASNLPTLPFVLGGLKFEVWSLFLRTTLVENLQVFSARIYDMYLHYLQFKFEFNRPMLKNKSIYISANRDKSSNL